MAKKLNDGQVWALSRKGHSVYNILTKAGLDSDIAFEVTLKILGEVEALELDEYDQNAME